MEPFKEEYDLSNYMDLMSYIFIKKRKYAEAFFHISKILKKKNYKNSRN